ncbi:MAG: hypothetical protein H5T64_00520 [Chloroflexi bacterium]|nr:hypothetical protein [Chloroflexota bacterium]
MSRIAEDAWIGDNVEIGEGVIIGPGAVIHDNVRIGDYTVVGAYVTLGEPLAAFYSDPNYRNPPTIIGPHSVFRTGARLYAGNTVGAYFEAGQYATMREYCTFGDYCRFDAFAQTDPYVTAGNYCHLHYKVIIASFNLLEDYVVFYPYSAAADSIHPPCGECRQGSHIEKYVVVGAHALIFPGLRIGEGAVICHGAMVNKSVPPGRVVSGIPAKDVGAARALECDRDIYARAYPWRMNLPDFRP